MNFILGFLLATMMCFMGWIAFSLCFTDDGLGGIATFSVLILIPAATFLVGTLLV